MLNKKRFKIGNMTVNLGRLDDKLKYKTDPNCQLTYTGCNNLTHICKLTECNNLTGCNNLTHICKLTGCNNLTGCGLNYSKPLDDWLQPELIPDLKASLISQLKEIEAYELELEIQETPQTLEEINALEVEFENSLKEIKELKKNF